MGSTFNDLNSREITKKTHPKQKKLLRVEVRNILTMSFFPCTTWDLYRLAANCHGRNVEGSQVEAELKDGEGDIQTIWLNIKE